MPNTYSEPGASISPVERADSLRGGLSIPAAPAFFHFHRVNHPLGNLAKRQCFAVRPFFHEAHNAR